LAQEKFERYTEEDYVKDVFEEGYADVAIFNPQILGDFYHNGFSNLKRNEAFKQQHPDRVITNGVWDPRKGTMFGLSSGCRPIGAPRTSPSSWQATCAMR
jgi:hypothetical protein